MKKSIIIGLSVIVAVVGGLFFKAKVVDADSFVPNMQLNLDKEESIETFVGQEFQVSITIVPEDMVHVITNPPTSNTIKNVYLECIPTLGLEVKSAKIGEKEFLANGNKINIDNIEYEDTAVGGWKTIAEDINVVLTYKATKVDTFNGVGQIKVLYDENERKTNPGQGSKVINKADKPIVTVGRLDYNIDYINGEAWKEEYRTVGLNKFFNLDYNINPGTLLEVDAEGKPLPTSIANENFEARDLIYVIDKAAIDLVGGNEEIARASIKKSLEELKKINPDTQTSLVVYGEEAEIITIDKKTKFSIDTLISAIDKIETSDKSGNLGDGIRKAKYLVNENSTSKSSIVIVSAGDPNYYTEISEGNTSMLETRVNKTGINKEDEEKAEEYANNIVNDIIINEEDETRWYGINYGIEKEELILNNIINKFEGFIPEVKSPYYDDFVNINSKATAAISIKATLSATVIDKNSGIIVHDDDKSKEIEITFNKTDDGFVAANLEEIKKQVIRVKIDMVTSEEDYINVADSSKLEVKLSVNFNDEPQEVIFNKRKELDLEYKLDPITWLVKVEIPYVIRTGLFNGRYKLTKPLKKDVIADMENVAIIAQDTLDEVSAPELAIENHYAFAAIVKTRIGAEAKLYYNTESGAKETIVGKAYELVEGEFINPVDIGSAIAPISLDPTKTYLVVVDDYVETDKIVGGEGKSFDIGVSIKNKLISPSTPVEDEVPSTPEISEWDNWGITVHPVPKPDHF